MVTSAHPVVNVEMAHAWDGDEGDRWTENEERYEAAVERFDAPLFSAAAITSPDSVLDVGCGCGSTTREAARRATTGRALGVDLSARMLERAREHARREGIDNVSFQQGDAQSYPFAPRSFDVTISRFGAMFFADPVAAFSNIASAMRPGGRLVLLGWQELRRNAWVTTVRDALAGGRALPEPQPGQPGPFGLADADGVRGVLVDAGFDGPEVEGYSAPVRLGADVDDAMAFLSGMGITRGLLADLDERSAAGALEELRSRLARHESPGGVLLAGAAWVITAMRR